VSNQQQINTRKERYILADKHSDRIDELIRKAMEDLQLIENKFLAEQTRLMGVVRNKVCENKLTERK